MFPFQTQRFIRLLQRKLGLQGFIPLTLVGDVTPMITVVTGDGPEDYLLREERRFSQFLLAAAVAGNLGRIQLDNPSANTLVIVEGWQVLSAPVMNCGWCPIVATGGGAVSPLDGRMRFLGGTAVAPTAGNLSAFNNLAASVLIGGAVAFVIPAVAAVDRASQHFTDTPIIIPPGRAWVWESGTVNALIQMNVRWREYTLAPAEGEQVG